MALELSVEEVKNAALCVLQEAEQRIKSLEALVVTTKSQLDEAKEQLFRMRQVEVEVEQWKKRATGLEKRVLELSEEREQLSGQLKEKNALQKNCNLCLPMKLKIIAPISVEVLPVVRETEEVFVGRKKVSTATFSVGYYCCFSIPNNDSCMGDNFNSVHKATNDEECGQWKQKRYSCSSITSESDSFVCPDSSSENRIHRNSEEQPDRLTSVSQSPTLQRSNMYDNISQTIDIFSFYSVHSSLMIAVGKLILQQVEKHTFCWKGMEDLSMEDLNKFNSVVNHMIPCWDISQLVRYELYSGKWIPCFKNIWRQIVMQFDDQRKIIESEHFLFFGMTLFCCFFNWKMERSVKTEESEIHCYLDESLHEDRIDDNVKRNVRSKLPNATHSSFQPNMEHFLTIRRAMEKIIHLLILTNDKAVKKCHYWKEQAQYHEKKASLFQNSFVELKEVVNLKQMRDDLSKELDGFKSFMKNLQEMYHSDMMSRGYQGKSIKQLLHDRIKALSLEIEKLEHERTKWTEERNKTDAKVQQMQLQTEDWKTKVERLQDLLIRNENMRMQLERKIVNAEEQGRRAKAEYEKLTETKELQIFNSQKTINELRIQLERVEQHLVETRKREYLLETQVDTLQRALESTKDELVVELVDTKIKLAQSYEELETLQSRKRGIS
ncbi:hypothetical protein Gasu2_70300 [Galdieria sulphuraria]|nr:hypothetical protein Gasu2_70300 [Galdieria sulphuraria]